MPDLLIIIVLVMQSGFLPTMLVLLQGSHSPAVIHFIFISFRWSFVICLLVVFLCVFLIMFVNGMLHA